jgi:hypothetical protein
MSCEIFKLIPGELVYHLTDKSSIFLFLFVQESRVADVWRTITHTDYSHDIFLLNPFTNKICIFWVENFVCHSFTKI